MRITPPQPLPAATTILRDRDFFTPGDPLFRELQERLAAIRLGVFMSVNVPCANGDRLALVLHRDLDDHRDFQQDEERFALKLLPHLHQAVQLGQDFNTAHAQIRGLKESMDHVRCALVLCSPDGRVIWANRSAERVFAHRTQLFLSGERLTAASAADTALLRRNLAELSASGQRSRCLVLGRNSTEMLHVMMQPIEDAPASEAGRRVLLMVSEPNATPSLPADVIAQVFGLSPAEARLAAALCSGHTVNEYAAAHGVSVGTARFQLKQVLAKTQVSRQSELVRHVCSSVIAHALPN